MNSNRQSGQAWLNASLLALFMLINYVDKISIGLMAVPMMKDLNLTAVQFGVIGGSFYWLSGLSGVAGGFLANRFKTRWILLGVSVIWAISQFPIALTSSIVVIVASRVLLGFGEGPGFPVAIHACYKWFPAEKRNLPTSMITAGPTVSLIVAGLFIPLTMREYGWRGCFVILGLVSVLWSVIWLVLGKEGPLDGRVEPKKDQKIRVPNLRYRDLLRQKTVLTCFLSHFLSAWVLSSTLFWLPSYLEKSFSISQVVVGRYFSIIAISTLPISIALSWASQRLLKNGMSATFARGKFLSFCLLIGGSIFCTFPFFQVGLVERTIGIAVALGFMSLCYTLVPVILADVTPVSKRGAILAIDNSIALAAGIFSSVVFGYFIEGAHGQLTRGYENGFACNGMVLLFSALIGVIWLRPDKEASVLASEEARQTQTH